MEDYISADPDLPLPGPAPLATGAQGVIGAGMRSEAGSDDPWLLSGQRISLAGGERSGLHQVRLDGIPVLRDARLEVGGRMPAPLWVDLMPDRVERVLEAGQATAAERLSAALEAPVAGWEVDPGDDGQVVAEWYTDLVPAGPASGHTLRLAGGPGQPEAVCQAERGLIQAFPAPGSSGTMVRVEARGALRLALVAGRDGGDLERALRALERGGGLDGLSLERIRHGDRLRTHLAAVEAPAAAIERAFEWAKARLAPPALLQPGEAGADVVAATLALGDRDIARDLLRARGRRNDREGYLELARPYAAWSADFEYLDRYQPGTSELLAGASPLPAQPEPAGEPDLEALARVLLEETRGGLDATGAARFVMAVVTGLWGVVPDAPQGVLTLAPWFPSSWRETALLRLRIGATLLDCRLRRRQETVSLFAEKVSGPPVTLTARLRTGGPLLGTAVNGEPLGAATIRCEVESGVEVRWTCEEGERSADGRQ
jgi:hypothetical protein